TPHTGVCVLVEPARASCRRPRRPAERAVARGMVEHLDAEGVYSAPRPLPGRSARPSAAGRQAVRSDRPPPEIMRAVCIARHRFLSDHICSIFRDVGLECIPVVGFSDGVTAARAQGPDVVICDYDLLVAAPLREWECDPALAAIPIVAVSLTRRPEEAHLVDANGIAGFLYLPSLGGADVKRAVQGATSRPLRAPSFSLRWDHPSGETIHLD